ncbi:GNAT family N-acetyltransferase [Capnocytophaga cynodegmi]|uniref:Acetyltransferase, GNAT family n=1 Tax=Capnocytophaga cynodegmi TaxID=28189 RepID=A0A0B7HIH6_9FLAO|nr:GNAT family N-acetyltransferase [Capnocytophaga cynodegmi]CEN35090.1 Acetyltransferase, GNAT family [Capnocytophaga cynodegmi]CEN38454.1 Acetyltransferase, GNAT family [Capnocytophaga cynodegmi]
MEIFFLEKTNITSSIEKQIQDLFSELSDIQTVSLEKLFSLAQSPYIALCSDENKIVGMATMAVYDVISGRKAWIEDVVVSSNYRKKGIGERLTQFLIEKAKELEVNMLLLYSNPKREAAHRLYKRMGFLEKGSTLFAMTIK